MQLLKRTIFFPGTDRSVWRSWTSFLSVEALKKKEGSWRPQDWRHRLHTALGELDYTATLSPWKNRLPQTRKAWIRAGAHGVPVNVSWPAEKWKLRGFAGRPVVRPLQSCYRGTRSIPGWGAKILQAIWQAKTTTTKTQIMSCLPFSLVEVFPPWVGSVVL